MSATKSAPVPTPEADAQAVFDRLVSGRPLDPETYRRVRERAERITEQLRRQHGEMEIAVDLIREVRQDE
jgi:hypothetical protein